MGPSYVELAIAFFIIGHSYMQLLALARYNDFPILQPLHIRVAHNE